MNRITARYTPELPTETDNLVEADQGAYDLMHRLIGEEPSLSHLRGVPIKLLFAKKARKSRGRVVLGSASVFPERDRLLHPYVFLVILDQLTWMGEPNKREPLLHHELLHCGVDNSGEEPKYTMVHHDFEEFRVVWNKYGDWNDEGVSQLNLFEDAND